MRAVTYAQFGDAEKVLILKDVPVPTPNEGEVLIKIHFSGVNPSDAKARMGNRPGLTRPAFDEIIPHSDGSGVITKVGLGVDPCRIGERVWIWNAQWSRAHGSAAEFIALPHEQAIAMPENMSYETGACLGIPGLTAAHSVLNDGSLTDQTLFISGGAGSVGNNAIQLAKWSGANVIASGSPNAFEYIRQAGADHVLDYNDPLLCQKVLEIVPNGVDRAIEVEFGENVEFLHEIVRPSGKISVFGSAKNMSPTLPFGSYLFKAIKIDIILVYILSVGYRKTAIKALHDAHDSDNFRPTIHKIYDLSECALAHNESLKSGRRGAILLRVN